MNGKRLISMILFASIAIAFVAPASWAGSPSKHRLEGAVIGIGALILTKAIVDHHRHHAVTTVTPAAHRHSNHRARHAPAGYWKIKKRWVPATYERVWNPGHYNRRGRWIPGRWIDIKVKPGHWSKRRIWVPYH